MLHPTASRAVVNSTNQVASGVVDFNGRLGIEGGRQSLEARRWGAAAGEVRDKVLETCTDGVGAAMDFGSETFGRARSVKDKLAIRIAEGALRRRADGEQRDEEEEPERVEAD
ncbi:hypothetical protein [Cryobacterium sp. TMS1-13-1]|uniref:hypothetical protein n=1 Tax=Cryobacterium sp. TMS1-13-1 TaxID=1259220 RepID=UPI00106D4EE7|nr:hypothetical protein [Cryobacterium sp. TMS1-13-1]TFD21340.1 hypothetical protein E3T31_10955 [Cryobacterium sp. TMS1-13-1]